MRVDIDNGHYTVVFEDGGRLYALRYGQEWRDCVGDNLILCLAQEVQSLREQLKQLTDGSALRLPTNEELAV